MISKLNKQSDMSPRLETSNEKKLIGKRIKMSFANDKTRELWQSFMPVRKEIQNTIDSTLYSLEVYDHAFFHNFNAEREFDKWAAVEVTDFNTIPAGMETLLLPVGLYAVFIFKGPASEGAKKYR